MPYFFYLIEIRHNKFYTLHVQLMALSKQAITSHCVHANMQCFQNALAYFITTVSYEDKMFMKVTPGCCQ